ncbi:hypothetical protein FG386_000646 [Cryptosporidium ryanae]|uniref:uncharacterized protein n=1 Tax=Cryptosporidium ryanae TaxID=515981 RepID=UPI00351A63EA|nr:hypothetical protein FG386_000646 [Cryptosporidium ryanae]
MVLEFLECEGSMFSEYEHLKSKIFVISNGIISISENSDLPILLNVLMDGINAYNKMMKKYQYSENHLLDLSFWSIELMDTIYAKNQGNTTLLDYTLEKIKDQHPHILDVFNDINYLERISENCKINEIYRGIMRLDFSLKIKTKHLIEFIENKKLSGIYIHDNLSNKIVNLNEALYFLKYEFLYLVKYIIFFSKYLGIDNLLYENDETVTKIEQLFEFPEKERNEKIDKFLSELDTNKYSKVLEAFNSLNWLRERLNIYLFKNIRDKNKLLGSINDEEKDILKEETKEN